MKKAEAEKRRIEALQKQIVKVSDPDEYLKIAKEIGYENLTPAQQQYVQQLEAAQQYVQQLEAAQQNAEIAKGIGKGLSYVGKDLVTGVYDFVTDPGGTIEGSSMRPLTRYKPINIFPKPFRILMNGIWSRVMPIHGLIG